MQRSLLSNRFHNGSRESPVLRLMRRFPAGKTSELLESKLAICLEGSITTRVRMTGRFRPLHTGLRHSPAAHSNEKKGAPTSILAPLS